CQQGNGLPFTF
nr:immunoglobulin light chain junction region [Macaca mulatta]MOV80495.1 immunoglobulin light chain junction region [Macaca mulatta]MOV81560.1 immunoglobulin light chain junction region [Macaca mulatta]MOV83424.1 immunoglobulin light chain junction region [Macaca mulatta]